MRDIMMIADGRIFENLNETSKYNQQIVDFLTKEGIQASNTEFGVTVDRTSMVIYSSRQIKNIDENDCYTYVLELIREQLPNNLKVFWAGRNDDWMSLDVYERSFSR